MPKTWRELAQISAISDNSESSVKGSLATGGLGKFMIPGQWEVWLCQTGVVCGGVEQREDVCFTYSEEYFVFVPWGLRSELDFA